MSKHTDPLSPRNIVAGLFITIVGAILVAIILRQPPFTPPTPSNPLEPTQGQSFSPVFPIEFTVPALGWADTNLEIHTGDRVSIEYVSGQWKAGPELTWDFVGPKGDGKYIRSDYRLPDYPLMCLIAQVGNNAPLYVGERIDFTASTTGRLQLSTNDIDNMYGDNEGSIIVRVSIQK